MPRLFDSGSLLFSFLFTVTKASFTLSVKCDPIPIFCSYVTQIGSVL